MLDALHVRCMHVTCKSHACSMYAARLLYVCGAGQVNGTAMPSDAGAECTISSHINEIKARNELIVITFELPECGSI